MYRVAGVLALIVLAAGLRAAEPLALTLATQDVLLKRLDAGGVPLNQRQAAARELFEQVGCSVVEQPVNKKFSNVICTLPGQTASTILVGAHYDYIEEGRGIVDDWSGVALLTSLYETLKTQPRQHTYQFVAFAAEEKGLIGSQFFVKSMSGEQRASMQAVVNLECLGLTPPKVWASRSTPILLIRLGEIASAIRVPLQGVNVEQVGDDDTRPFLKQKMPVITIHSVTTETFSVLHTRRDNRAALHADDYAAAYRLVAFYLAYLDLKLV
jgi:Zn-dependent M28 family amino/carboxypeptidase